MLFSINCTWKQKIHKLKRENPIMIEYAQAILPKVSPWKNLFRKELIKCLGWAQPAELEKLQRWCYDNFYALYPDVILEVCDPKYRSIKIPKNLLNHERSINRQYIIRKVGSI
jgi:hypothetical protein